MSTVRLTVTARATDSNLCYAHIKLMQQKAHIELMLLAFKGHTSRPPHKGLNFSKRFTNLLSGPMTLILNKMGLMHALWVPWSPSDSKKL